jgi:threonine dehydrogenase-like Zn-dependent dehydrogenase
LADVAIDVSAYATQPVVDALDVVKPGGTVVLAGIKGPTAVPGFLNDKVVVKNITIKGVFGVDRPAYVQAIAIIESGRFPLARMHTHDFPLADAATAVRTLAGEISGERAVHVTIRPWA